MQPAGGIATYLQYIVPAMRAAGHDVFLFSWCENHPSLRPMTYAPFEPDNVHIEFVNCHEVWRIIPVVSQNLFIAEWLSDKIIAKMREWEIDIVESTDYLSPCLTLYQKIQAKAGADRQILVTYNHGFIEDFFESDQIRFGTNEKINHLCERQQCRVSDVVIAPSECARARLGTYGIKHQVTTVREPYAFSNKDGRCGDPRNVIEYLGRISVSKGIDKLIYFTNTVHEVYPLRQVRLIGRVVPTPFRQSDMGDYVRDRLSPDLRESLFFSGYISRKAALAMLEPGSISPSLGSAETFSYACVESIDAGLLPIVRHGTPMAEFFPEHWKHLILDEEMRSIRGMQKQVINFLENAAEVSRDVRAYCQETLAPELIAEKMGQTYDVALSRKRTHSIHAVPRRSFTASDVTVLIPAYMPNHEFMETIDSLAWQSSGAPNVLICDDGTPETHRAWFDYAFAMLRDCRIVRQPNCGLLAARNTLIEECRTDLSLFIDTDDLLAPNLLEHLLEAMNTSHFRPDAVIPQRRNFGESAEPVLRHLMDDHLHILENDYRMTALIRTQVLREIGFDATRRNGEADDWAFWLQFSGRGHVAILLPEQGFLYRFRTGSMSWPWSQGQNVGSQVMVRNAVVDMCEHDDRQVLKVARALYARNIGW